MNKLALVDMKAKEQQLLQQKLCELGSHFADPVWRENLNDVIANIALVHSEFNENIHGVCEVIKKIDSYLTSQSTVGKEVQEEPHNHVGQEGGNPPGLPSIHHVYINDPKTTIIGGPINTQFYTTEIGTLEAKITKLEDNIKELKEKESQEEAKGHAKAVQALEKKIELNEAKLNKLEETVQKDKSEIEKLEQTPEQPAEAPIGIDETKEDKPSLEDVINEIKKVKEDMKNTKEELDELNKQLKEEENKEDPNEEEIEKIKKSIAEFKQKIKEDKVELKRLKRFR
jgi:uncharacterized phage infection (PIP) family protein YhgE